MPEELTLADILLRQTAAHPERPALVFDGAVRTWTEVGERAARTAQALRRCGVGAGDRVAIYDRNRLEHFDVTFGAALLGAVPVGVNWRLAGGEVRAVIEDSGAKVVVVGDELAEVLDQIRSSLPAVEEVVVLGNHPRWPSFEAWITAGATDLPPLAAASEDTCLQVYTSGTTGLPKGVLITNRAIASLGHLCADSRFTKTSVNLAAMPLFHVGGMAWALVGMLAGATTVVVRDFEPARVLDVLQEEGVTHALLAPSMLQMLTEDPTAPGRAFPSLELISYGGSPITPSALRASLSTFGCPHRQLYGMTETTGPITCLGPEDHDPGGSRDHLLASAGRPYPWVEMRVLDATTGQACAVGEVGEVVCRGAQNTIGYWNRPEETAEAIDAEGWLRTGDAGYVDADGYLFLTARVKDMIITGGENVYPVEVEAVLSSHPSVLEVAVIGVPHERWGETVKAVVVPRPGATVDPGELIAHARAVLAGYKCPTSVEVVVSLPRNASGKVLTTELRAAQGA